MDYSRLFKSTSREDSLRNSFILLILYKHKKLFLSQYDVKDIKNNLHNAKPAQREKASRLANRTVRLFDDKTIHKMQKSLNRAKLAYLNQNRNKPKTEILKDKHRATFLHLIAGIMYIISIVLPLSSVPRIFFIWLGTTILFISMNYVDKLKGYGGMYTKARASILVAGFFGLMALLRFAFILF